MGETGEPEMLKSADIQQLGVGLGSLSNIVCTYFFSGAAARASLFLSSIPSVEFSQGAKY